MSTTKQSVRRWEAPKQPARRAFFHVEPEGDLGLHVACECGATCDAYPSLVLFVTCNRCGSDVPIAWDNGVA